jgi:hypothetical protein
MFYKCYYYLEKQVFFSILSVAVDVAQTVRLAPPIESLIVLTSQPHFQQG